MAIHELGIVGWLVNWLFRALQRINKIWPRIIYAQDIAIIFQIKTVRSNLFSEG